MKIGIVLKLFILTTLLCMFILATVFIGQTIFFKQYYENQKVEDIEASIDYFSNKYLKSEKDMEVIQKLEQNFYQENMTWIATLDSVGNIKYANDFSLKVQLNPSKDEDTNRIISIPLYSFIDLEEMKRGEFYLKQGNPIYIDGIKKDNRLIPIILTVDRANLVLENMLLSEKLYGYKEIVEAVPIKEFEIGELEIKIPLKRKYRSDFYNHSGVFLTGVIQDLVLPMGAWRSNIYSNRLFIERIREFQANLLFNEKQYSTNEIIDFEENGINYKIFIKQVRETTGETTYIFAMTSLQPVDEAVQMLEDYYVYIILLVLVLVVLVSFYYSKKIAKPLLQINETTNKIANLDFSKTIPVTSNDEIGALSQNINKLSSTLHLYIKQLHEDIEKEKRLENTRKEFISSVSHELKTPLSIIKSCISILQDGVASDKRDYYFKAMADEVDKMDLLIIDMLELAKFESGTYKLNMDVFYIDELIEYICQKLNIEVMDKQLQLHKELSKIKVIANEHRIEQVLMNFITNAIRYTPINERIFISLVEEEERVKICIENKGAHIAEEHLDKIWDRFYRGDMSRSRSEGGTGLGLAISKNILELHDSEYGVTNTENGVLFYFYLKKDV